MGEKTCGIKKAAHNRIDLTGRKFGYLTVLGYGETRGKVIYWLCRCECGVEKLVCSTNLKSGSVTSCGCMHHEASVKVGKLRRTHGMSHTRLWSTWARIRNRCYNPSVDSYPQYGGRGIGVCDEWREHFESFRDWALSNGYADDLSIDRIDVNGDYEPNNCRWATNSMQQLNKRNNRIVEYKGVKKALTEWSSEYNIPVNSLHWRLGHGWSVERALTTPIRHKSNKGARRT